MLSKGDNIVVFLGFLKKWPKELMGFIPDEGQYILCPYKCIQIT